MSHCYMSVLPYYLYNCCYFQVQFAAVWTHGSKGCHWLHVTNAPKAHIHTADQYPKNSFNDTMWKLHESFVCWCVSEPSILYYIVVATLEMRTGCQFCVPHYPLQIYPQECKRADQHELPDTAAAIDGRNIWIEMVLFWSFGLEIDRMNAGSCEHMCAFMSLCSMCVWIHLSISSQRMIAAELLQGNTWRILFICDRQ